MKIKLNALTLLACSLLLGACNSSLPINSGVGEPTGKLATIKVLVQLPKGSASGVQPQGVPQTAVKATVSVYDGSNLIGQKEVGKSGQNSDVATIKLPVNKNYSFTISAQDSSTPAKEVAWGSLNYEVTRDATVTVPLKGILESVALTAAPGTSVGKEYLLNVLSPNGEVPINDFEVVYKVVGGQVITQSKLGVTVNKSAGETATVTASVSGLGADHQPKTLVVSKIVSGSDLAVTGNFANFPKGYAKPLTIKGITPGGQPISGMILPGGNFSLILPDVTGELNPVLDLFTADFGASTNTAKVTPSDTKGTRLYTIRVLTDSGLEVGSIGRNEVLPYVDSRLVFNSLVYVDQDSVIEGLNQNVYKELKHALNSGWNIGILDTGFQRNTYTFTPLIDNAGKVNDLLGLRIKIFDASVKYTVDIINPLPDSEVNHTVQYDSKSEQKIILTIPRSLSLIGSLSSSASQMVCTGPVETASDRIYTCGAPSSYTLDSWTGTMNFKTRTEPLGTFSPDPNDLLVKLTTGNYIDTNPANDSVKLTFTRQVGSADVVIRSDMQAPEVTFAVPSLLKVNQAFNLTGLVSDNEAPSKVEVYRGVNLLGQATLSGQPINAWTYLWTPSATGTYLLNVVAYDAAGNTAKTQRSVTVAAP